MILKSTALLTLIFAALQLPAASRAQTNSPAPPGESRAPGVSSLPALSSVESGSVLQTAAPEAVQAVRAEKIRAACIQGRRCVCGRVLKVFPTGLLVESGYPSLLRDSLHGAWYLPGTVTATRPANLVEKKDPDCLCVGTVCLTDLPKLRGARIQPYDYVVLHSYPAGEYTYTALGNKHTVRRFSGGLDTAVRLILESESAGRH